MKARVRGVKGTGCVLGTFFISHTLSLLLLETGESVFICMSSTSILWFALCSAVGHMDHSPRRRFNRKMNLQNIYQYMISGKKGRGTHAMNTVQANAPLAMLQ